MIGPGVLHCSSSVFQVSTFHSPVGSKNKSACRPVSRHRPVVCGTSGVWGSGQSGLATSRKQKRGQCGRRRRTVVQCEADGAKGFEIYAGESSSENGSKNSPSTVSEIADAGQSPGKMN